MKTRNRHTGHINAFKKAIIARGKKITLRGRIYYRALVKGPDSYCVVRTK